MLLLQPFFHQTVFLSVLCFSSPAALAMGLCVAMIAFVRLPSLKVSCLLLSGLLIYDVFWVRKAPIQEFTSITATAMRCSRLCTARHTQLKDIHRYFPLSDIMESNDSALTFVFQTYTSKYLFV